MDKIVIEGGTPLNGVIKISGAKNAALPLMAASLLTDDNFVLKNVPGLADIASLSELLQQHGATIQRSEDTLSFSTPKITSTTAPYEIVRKMRASVLVLGPLMARCHEAIVSLPGGCAIGTRPVDLHIKGLEAMGATIDIRDGYIHAKAEGGLKGADYRFPTVTVGGTENLLMAATLAKGTTRLHNAAKEPEVTDLANCLVKMGAQIEGIGTSQLTIHGVEKLGPATHDVLPDRIETGTYMVAAAITGGKLDLINTSLDLLPTFDRAIAQTGVEVTTIENGIRVDATNRPIKPVSIETHPFPGIATDLQAQFMALMCVSTGTSTINETIFENRFMHVPELARMGADIMVNGSVATVKGVKSLKGAPVMATDLRASVSLVLAGLVANGTTEVNRVYHLDRGYESIEVKLSACGANIRRASDQADNDSPLKLVK